MSQVHRMSIDISFKHCDPAGIVFYPRYVEMLNDVVEQWFRNGLGCDFAQLHGLRGIAIPIVKLDVEFKRPSLLGETLESELMVEEIGRSSARLRITFFGVPASASEARLVAHLKLVFVRMQGKTSMEIPADLRGALEKYLSDFREPKVVTM